MEVHPTTLTLQVDQNLLYLEPTPPTSNVAAKPYLGAVEPVLAAPVDPSGASPIDAVEPVVPDSY